MTRSSVLDGALFSLSIFEHRKNTEKRMIATRKKATVGKVYRWSASYLEESQLPAKFGVVQRIVLPESPVSLLPVAECGVIERARVLA